MPAFGGKRARITAAWQRRILAGASVGALMASTQPAAAETLPALAVSFNSLQVAWLSALLGAVAFGVANAVVLVRNRRRSQSFERRLRTENADLKLRLDRFEALLDTDDQRLVIWDGSADEPLVIGGLDPACGAPRGSQGLLAFGTWLEPGAAALMEAEIDALRQRGVPFQRTLPTRSGGSIEVCGRTAGSWAVLRLRDLTGERLAQARLADSHARLEQQLATMRSLLDEVPGPVWLRDGEGDITWVNKAYAAAVEAGSPELAVETRTEFLDAAGRKALRDNRDADRLFRGRMPVVSAGKRHVFDVIDVIGTSGSAGIAIDVNEMEQVREELKRTVEFHARTLDQLATAVAIFGPDRRLQFHNSAFQDLFGLDSAFLESRPENGAVLDAMRAARKLPEQADYRDWRRKHLDAYQSLEAEPFMWHLPDGKTLRVVATPHAQGGVSYIYENVTELLELESSYNKLTRVQGETLDHLSEAVAVFGSDGRLRLSNPAFAAIWQLGEDDLRDSPHISAIVGICSRLHPDLATWKELTTTVTGLDENRSRIAGRMERPDGNVIDYATVPLPDGGTLIAFVNATDTVNVERALRDKNEALREADQLKNTFIQQVSYELRSPLTNIIGFAQLLSDSKFGDLTEKQAEYTDYIMASSSALLAIINDILDLATIDAGIMELDLGEVDIAAAVDGAVEGLKDRLVEADIELRVDVPGDIGVLIADERRLRQVLFNLLSNALRYSQEGGLVELTCARTPNDLRFVVRDHGCGISPEHLDEVFNRFVSHTTGSRRRGAGLGLAIVKSFVELHGGTVEIQSQENVGTTVICKFPVRPQIPEREAAE